MKVILDCNVIIAAGLTNGVCRKVVYEVIANHTHFISEEIMLEYIRVINRKKFESHKTHLEDLLKIICEVSKFIDHVDNTKCFNLDDKDDEKYLYLAHTIKADCLITGNLKDFPIKRCSDIKVLSPSDFLKLTNEVY